MALQSDDLLRIIDRELQSLSDQVRSYTSDDDLWKTPDGISNSGGTLALHLCGNLRHFVGARMGSSGYTRDRASEFAGEKRDRTEVLEIVEDTRREVGDALRSVDDARMDESYPDSIAGVQMTNRLLLVHLVSHLGYHLGQIDYHRRLVTGQNQPVGTLSIPKLLIDQGS